MVKRIAVLTSGGDAPGMNAAIRAVIRTATYYSVDVFGVYEGYSGLVKGKIEPVGRFSDSINRGGTLLMTSRLPEFHQKETRQIAIDNLKAHKIDALVVIGGDGSYQGAEALYHMGFNTISLPGTIDNDVVSTDYTIGFDTALNTILDAVDKLRDTSGSHQRCSVIEVMGRKCGDLAIYASICGGAEIVVTNETGLNRSEVFGILKNAKKNGKKHAIVIVTEGIVDVHNFAKEITKETGYESRATILGHVQRGGSPTAMDRVLASRMGSFAVDVIVKGFSGRCIGISGNKLIHKDICEALKMEPRITNIYEIIEKLI